MHLSIVRRTLRPPGDVRHVPSMSSQNLTKGVCQVQLWCVSIHGCVDVRHGHSVVIHASSTRTHHIDSERFPLYRIAFCDANWPICDVILESASHILRYNVRSICCNNFD